MNYDFGLVEYSCRTGRYSCTTYSCTALYLVVTKSAFSSYYCKFLVWQNPQYMYAKLEMGCAFAKKGFKGEGRRHGRRDGRECMRETRVRAAPARLPARAW